MGEAKRRKLAEAANPGSMADRPTTRPQVAVDPDDAFPAHLALDIEVPVDIRKLIVQSPMSDPIGFMSDHPVPMFLRLHAEGMTVSDLAASIVEVARAGLAESKASPSEDADEWDAERLVTVQAHLDAHAGRTCGLRPDLADFLLEMGYNWFAFDDDENADVAGVLDVRRLDRIAAMGGTLGHFASVMADILEIE